MPSRTSPDRIDFAKVSASVDLFDLATRYTTLTRSLNGPCPVCGGVDRFYISRDRRHMGCRKCGLKGDALDLVMAVQNVGLVEAAKMLGGNVSDFTPPAPRQAEEAHRQEWKRLEWQDSAGEEVRRSSRRLGDSVWGEIGQDYLRSRGLSIPLCQAWGIGFNREKFDPVTSSQRPSIVVPWYAPNGDLTAVKYRFTDEIAARDHGKRFLSKGGSEPVLFGLQRIGGAARLMVSEGEMNALALAQALSEDWDVLSVGSEANPLGYAPLRRIMRDYLHKSVWVDDPKRLAHLQDFLGFDAGIVSPEIGPAHARRRVDANDFLVERFLGGEKGLRRYVTDTLGTSSL